MRGNGIANEMDLHGIKRQEGEMTVPRQEEHAEYNHQLTSSSLQLFHAQNPCFLLGVRVCVVGC